MRRHSTGFNVPRGSVLIPSWVPDGPKEGLKGAHLEPKGCGSKRERGLGVTYTPTLSLN